MKVPKCFNRNFKIIAMAKLWIKSYHTLSLLIVPYHSLFSRLTKKIISFDNFKISFQVADFLSHFIAPCRSLSYLIAPYCLHWRKNHFHLATWRLVPRLKIFYHIWSLRCHSLSHIITRYYPLGWKESFSFGKSKISFQASVFFVTSYQSFSLLFTPHHTQLPRGKENNYHLAIWKLVPIRQNFYHILLLLATRCHTLSPYHRGYLGWKENHFYLET